MQIAAMNPLAVDRTGIDAVTVAQETAIAQEQARNEKIPEHMLEKVTLGKLNRFFKANTLLNQPFIKKNNLNVAQYLDSVAKGLTVASFKRVTIS